VLERKNKAIDLRKSGLSYRAIQKELGIPLSTLSNWFGGEEWSRKIAQNLMVESTKVSAVRLAQFKKARGFALQFSYAETKIEAPKEYKKFAKNPLFFAGLILYWVAGDQASKYYLRLKSADPQKIILFKKFLTEVLDLPNDSVSYHLTLSSGLKSPEIEQKWSEIAKIPLRSFTKSSFHRKPRGKTPNPSSVCTITYSSRILKEKMLVWLRLKAQELELPEKADMVLGSRC